MKIEMLLCRAAAVTALVGVIAACSPVTHVRTSGPARLPPSVRLMIAPPDGQPVNERLGRFAVKISEALARHGVTVSPQSDYALTLTLAERPGDVGVTQERLTAKQPTSWLSAPSPKHALQLCHSQITRIGIVGQGSGAGPVALAAQGEIDGCGNSETRLGQLAEELAARLTRG